ncbi:Uncharacterized conserved protein, DUF2267 family [Micromonospora viridifaciens]|uniref:Uncharacterized conserved protein, DUF2267 family n=1 Tax=Micromonospora viridifaciens TaxID=1881 RepID=A0A1C4XIL3_MICVI|nr:DUF2267 domain-containing protein [Micromonospora viridifaciens]SCF08297.1 Uncharacterized conserved protein, DUF2267 family [Micromonospora viridifaciens]
MKYQEFVARVRERGEYDDAAEAQQVISVVVTCLAERLTPDEARQLGSQLPPEMGDVLKSAAGGAQRIGVTEFLRKVSDGIGATERTAEWDASAVLSTIADAVSGGELNDVVTQLPSGYAALFGRPNVSG